MAYTLSSNPSDDYQLDHQLDTRNPRNFFMGQRIISDQISRESLGIIWNELGLVLTNKVPGAVVEFGCYVGTTSVYLRRQLDTHGESVSRELHVYDSFEGLPAKVNQDENAAGVDFKQGSLQVSKRELLEQFRRAGLQPPRAHRAWFSELTSKDVPRQIAFAFLDGDFYTSIRDSLQLVLPRIQPGGTIIIDDYAREALPGAQIATREILPKYLFDTITIVHDLGIVRL